jgi:hypothetical protein
MIYILIPYAIRGVMRYLLLKSKSSPATRHGGAWGESKYSSYSFLTSELDGVSGQRHAPAALYPRGKDPRIQRIEEKSFASAGNRNPIARSSSP